MTGIVAVRSWSCRLIEDDVPIEAGRPGVEDEQIRAAPASAREFR